MALHQRPGQRRERLLAVKADISPDSGRRIAFCLPDELALTPGTGGDGYRIDGLHFRIRHPSVLGLVPFLVGLVQKFPEEFFFLRQIQLLCGAICFFLTHFSWRSGFREPTKRTAKSPQRSSVRGSLFVPFRERLDYTLSSPIETDPLCKSRLF